MEYFDERWLSHDRTGTVVVVSVDIWNWTDVMS